MHRITEGTVLFDSILKWFVLASFVGVMVGLSTTLFLLLLDKAIGFTGQFNYIYLLLPVERSVSLNA